MRFFLTIAFLFSMGNANILFLGNSDNKYFCDGEEHSAMNVEECKNIKAITDISFCYLFDSKLGCKKLFKNEEVNLSKIDNKPIEFSRLLTFNSTKQITFGVKRFSKGMEKLKDAIIPHADILKPNEKLTLFIPTKKEKIILIRSKTKEILKKKSVNERIYIPSNILNYDKTYKISIIIENKEYTNSFSIIDKQTQKDINKDISDATKNISDKRNNKIIKSISYDQYGLTYDRTISLKGLL